jgi:hypothetical protein
MDGVFADCVQRVDCVVKWGGGVVRRGPEGFAIVRVS